jgi:hypothetical protein
MARIRPAYRPPYTRLEMAKRWVLETHTKGTGANIVPLTEAEQGQAPREREPEPVFVHPPTRPKPPKPPEPRKPRRFRVVDVTTREVLADDALAREALAALRDVHSVTDVAISSWSEKHGRYRLLTVGEQQALWEMRRRA